MDLRIPIEEIHRKPVWGCVNSQKTCLSVKNLVDSNLLLLCYDYRSFKVVTEIPKLAFSGTMVSEYL